MSDPSYLGQILVFTSPMIGNYGVPSNSSAMPGLPILESGGVQCTGVVVSDVALKYSHYQAVESLHQWCERYDVPGLTGVDTRAITTLLRNQGTTLGRLAVGSDADQIPSKGDYWDPSLDNLVAQASTPSPYTLNEGGSGPRIAILDFGSKANILRSLVKRDAVVTVLPWDYDFNAVRDQYDGLFLSNGPGDPKQIMETAYRVKKTIDEWNRPIFGICMGHQILGLAAGMEAYRMTFGNRGHNQPVLALASSGSIKAGRVYVTVSLKSERKLTIAVTEPSIRPQIDGRFPLWLGTILHQLQRFLCRRYHFHARKWEKGLGRAVPSGISWWTARYHRGESIAYRHSLPVDVYRLCQRVSSWTFGWTIVGDDCGSSESGWVGCSDRRAAYRCSCMINFCICIETNHS